MKQVLLLLSVYRGGNGGLERLNNMPKIPQGTNVEEGFQFEPAAPRGFPGGFPGSWVFPGGEHGNPLQYFGLENPMDRGAWRATVHRVAKSWTQLSNLARRPMPLPHTLFPPRPPCLHSGRDRAGSLEHSGSWRSSPRYREVAGAGALYELSL